MFNNSTLILCIADFCGLDAQFCMAALTSEFAFRKLAVVEYKLDDPENI